MATAIRDYSGIMAEAAAAAGVNAPIVLPTDHWVDLNGLRFHYLDWGNAHLPHVVLLHGGSLTAHTWDMAALLLRDHYHLVALDQRGHGDSGWTPEEQASANNNDLMAEDTRQFLDFLGFERFSLVGMSMGGMNTMRYAAHHPTRLDAVGIVDVAPETMREGQIEMEQFREATETLSSFDDFLDRARRFMPHRPVAHLRYSLSHSLKQTNEGWTWKQDHRRHQSTATAEERAAELAARADSLWADVRAITPPTILFRGENSKILSQEFAGRTVAAMPNADLVVIPRATHNVHSDNPVDFAAALHNFLQRRLPK